ncbi:MAG TPA: 16S rRNA (cytosine(967)-C(5))-methyltransferase RsmB [Gallionellaceae bacterium]|nr:16S rRNA (cytosine(967)-C(5))-methyltransferase RsmB [Gallionellaceae bacterium]
MHAVQRQAARVVGKVLGGRNLNQVLAEAFQGAPHLSPQERAALQDMSYGTLRFYGQLNAILAQLLHRPLRDEFARHLLLVALYQLQYGKSAPYAVVDHAVRAVRKIHAGAAGLANAVLRQFLREREALLAGAAASDAGRYSYPQWWIDQIRTDYGADADAILQAGNQHPPMTLRVNRRRMDCAAYRALLAAQGMEARQVGEEALLLARPAPVEGLPGFREGVVSVQDAGAQRAAHLLDLHDGMRVLDACAAPGGKTAHILELARVDLLALDKDAQRLQRVGENMERLQLPGRTMVGDAAHPEDWWDGKPFDRILADVPCSASGVVRRHPDIKWLRRPADIVGFAQQQGAILAALWQALASDGKLLYATCSVFPQENRRVIEEFMGRHRDARLLPATGTNKGQLLPNDQHDGFYYALLHKHA